MAQQVARQPGALQIAISSDELINYMTDSEKFGDQPNVNAQDDQTVVDKLALLAYAFPQLASQPDMVTPEAYREYGFTDVHFAARLRQTPGCHRISSERPIMKHVANFTDAMALEPAPPLIHLERVHSSHDIAANKAILRKKFQGQLPWSTDYLRFSWEWVFGADGLAQC